jgi:PKD repeat protein
VSNDYGANQTVPQTIWVVNDLPVASFYTTPSSSSKNPARVFFTDTSKGAIDAWNWSFELGGQIIGTSAEQNPVMIFDKPGTYLISLIVSNDGGNSVPATGTFIVGNERATVFFDADPLWGRAPLEVQFTPRLDPDFKPKTLTWDFGDGNGVVWECGVDICTVDPKDDNYSPKHTYPAAGTYSVTLTADDGLAIYVSDPVPITVGEGPSDVDFRMNRENGALVDDNGASIGENIFFTDLSKGDPDSWQWDFGDGSWSSVRSPMHSYSAAGSYYVTLTAGNRYTSASRTHSILITENAPTEADFDFECNPEVNPFIPTTELQCKPIIKNENLVVTTWSWQFNRDGIERECSPGDDWCSSEKEPYLKINVPGTYDVKLTIGNNGGKASKMKPEHFIVGEGNNVKIYPGWNHVSVPVELVDGFNTMKDIFAGIPTGSWPYSVYNWETQDWGEVADNYIVRPLELVRVNSIAEGNTTFVFPSKEGTYDTFLQKGWNGIGISAWQPIIASKALESLGENWDRVIGYDARNQVWEEPIYRTTNADHEYMHPGMGYLIYMNADVLFKNGVKL